MEERYAQASSGPISFGGVKWTPWHTLFAVQGDKLVSLPKPRPGFNYGHTGDGRGAIIVANVGDSDWRDYSVEFEYCVTGIDPAFNPYGIGSDYHDGRIYFHLAEAHESWNQRGGSGYNIGIHGNGTWDLSCCYNNYCPAPVGYAPPVKDGERQLAHGQGLKIDRELGNKFRIDVVGQRIRIWVDGEKIADLVDDKIDELIGGQRLTMAALLSSGDSKRWAGSAISLRKTCSSPAPRVRPSRAQHCPHASLSLNFPTASSIGSGCIPIRASISQRLLDGGR